MATERRLTIFLSWSKDHSRAIAAILKDFLEDVLGIAEVFVSEEIDPGRRWSAAIAQALERSQAGVIIVTPENVREPWLYFEAGAISKNTQVAQVIPLLWGMTIGELAGTPLTQFQARAIDDKGLRDLCRTLGALAGVSDDIVQRRFSTNWPRVNDELAGLPPIPAPVSRREPGISDVSAQLEHITSAVDALVSDVRQGRHQVSPGIMGQGPFATVGPAEAARLVRPYLGETVGLAAAAAARQPVKLGQRQPLRVKKPKKD